MIQKVIAGIPRSGKSTVCKATINGNSTSYIPFDSIISSLYDNFPDLKISHYLDSQEVSRKIAPFIKSFTKHLIFEHVDFIIDAYQLYPIDVAINEIAGIDFYFFGYPDVNIDKKLEQIRRFSTTGSWTDDLSDLDLRHIIEKYKNESLIMKEQCLDYNFPFIDMSSDFTSSLNVAIRTLTS